jgi:hypothetical protein
VPSQKPTQPPAGDFGTFAKALWERVRKPDNSPYQVFADGTLPRFTRWVGGTAEYDGTGLRDTVNANAEYLDAVKNDLDKHKGVDNDRHAALAQRVTALEGQTTVSPFPGSG